MEEEGWLRKVSYPWHRLPARRAAITWGGHWGPVSQPQKHLCDGGLTGQSLQVQGLGKEKGKGVESRARREHPWGKRALCKVYGEEI